jgi:DNA-directed RNA polymerase specialized sigma24 family protein
MLTGTFVEDLAEGLSSDGPADHERSVLTEEVKLGMLQCLYRPHRLAYVLCEILDLPAPEAAAALDLEPGAFRKRLHRAREAIEAFTCSHCGTRPRGATLDFTRRVVSALEASQN